MALKDSGLKVLLPKEKKYRVYAGDAMYVPLYANTSFGNIGSLPTAQFSSGTIRSVLLGKVLASGC